MCALSRVLPGSFSGEATYRRFFHGWYGRGGYAHTTWLKEYEPSLFSFPAEPTSASNSLMGRYFDSESYKFILTWLGGLYDHQGRPPLARPMHCTRHGAELVEISNGDSRKHHFYPEGSAFAPPLFFLLSNPKWRSCMHAAACTNCLFYLLMIRKFEKIPQVLVPNTGSCLALICSAV